MSGRSVGGSVVTSGMGAKHTLSVGGGAKHTLLAASHTAHSHTQQNNSIMLAGPLCTKTNDLIYGQTECGPSGSYIRRLTNEGMDAIIKAA